ncbi:MAG: DUF2088 domain-containing protein [Candidatus Nealsonbacteria bacterium]|nr:DUF2088 domain-containing protein [Candidatus Nealsonbacteria bacterium]
MAILRYGIDSTARLEPPEGGTIVECGRPQGRPLADLTAAVTEALNDPLEYPPFLQSTTPGDRVVLALEYGLPQPAQIALAIIRSLVDAGVHPDGIAVLQPEADAQTDSEDPRHLLPEPIRERVNLITHDLDHREKLAFLATNDGGEPIMLARAIHDADLVIPVGCVQHEASAGYWGIHGPIFPTFSDRKTLRRFRSPAVLNTQSKRKRELLREVDQVAWMLGIQFSVQIVAGEADSVLHVVAGGSDAVGGRCRELHAAAWSGSMPQQAPLVVAALEGDRRQQSWENLGRALDAACALVDDDGAIVVCCDLAEPPGPAFQRLAGARSRDGVLRHIRKDRPVDTLPAAQLIQALDRCRVYLLSRLAPTLVEDIEVVHVASADELARLVGRHRSCILLANASRAVVTVE